MGIDSRINKKVLFLLEIIFIYIKFFNFKVRYVRIYLKVENDFFFI